MKRASLLIRSAVIALGFWIIVSMSGALAARQPRQVIIESFTPQPTVTLMRRSLQPTLPPSAQVSQKQWDHFVRTQVPTLDSYKPGPFAVWQNRRFERGETLVPPSVHLF